jgi:hypothetical protein
MDMRFIRKNGHNWRIDKCIDGKKYYFGAHSSIEEAINARDYFEKKGWENCLNERLKHGNRPKYISGNPKRGYEVRKIINGECNHFGVFSDLETAKQEVEACKKAEWDYETLCNLDETEGNPQYLSGSLRNAGVWK